MILVTKNIYRIKAENGESVKFVPNVSQQKIINIIEQAINKGEKVRLIIVKGRQLGGSSLIQRIMLSYAQTTPNFSGYTVAHNTDSAKAIFDDHIKYAFDTLPGVFKSLYKVDRNNVCQLKFENPECYGSSIRVGSSARSKTISFLHVSEAAEIAKDYSAWMELINGSFEAANQGHIILESTTAGLNLFYDFVTKQITSNYPEYQVLFLPWMDAKKYQRALPHNDGWKKEYLELAKKHKLELDPQARYNLTDEQFFFYYNKAVEKGGQVKAEYPLCIEEAFVSSSDTIFEIENIIELDKTKKPFVTNSGVKIYVPAVPGRKYSVGIDPVTGEGQDSCSISVVDYITREQVACTGGKYTPEEAAVLAVNLGYYYNKALITCETNGNGIATSNEIRKLEYPEDRIFKRFVIDSNSQTNVRIPKFGFATTGKNRPVMISELRHAVEEGEQKINDAQTLQQMKTFVRKLNGRVEHEEGYHDDCIFGLMLANEGCKYISQYL